MEINKAELLPKWFGDFGGILIPDAFIPDVKRIAKESEEIIKSDKFEKLFLKLTADFPEINITEYEADSLKVFAVKSQCQMYIIAGHIALASLRKSLVAAFGAESKEQALLAAKLAKECSVSIKIILKKELSEDEGLKNELKAYGAEVDDKTCTLLYNRPQPYAFQQFIGDRRGCAFIPSGAETGCWPFTALSGYFAEKFALKVKSELKVIPDLAASTIKYGNSAVGLFRAYDNEKCRFATIQKPICQSFTGEYCGAVTEFVRPAAYEEYNYTICPELCNRWAMAQVIKLGRENYTQAEAEDGLKATSVRAVNLIKSRISDIESVLLLEGEDE